MTSEQAKSELMQIYMSLSEGKKKALDVAFKAMEQADNIPVMYYPQVDGITPTVVAQADGEYILKSEAIRVASGYCHPSNIAKELEKLPSVDIPPEHDGCKDCVYQDNPQDAMPCRECKQNYMDKWKARPNKEGHWEVMYEPKNMVVCSKCGKCAYLYNNRGSAYCPHCGDYKGGKLNG